MWKAMALEPAGETLALADEAIRLADEIGDPRLTLSLASDWAVTYGNAGRTREGVRLAERVCEQARSDPRVRAGMAHSRSYRLLLCAKAAAQGTLGRLEEGLRDAEEACRLAREQRADEVSIWVAIVRAQIAAAVGDSGQALRDAREAVDRAEKVGGVRVRGSSYVALAEVHLEAERWSEARKACEHAMADHGNGAWYARAVAQLAHACLGEGDLEGAQAAVEEARSLMRNGPERFELDGRLAHACVLLRAEGAAAADRIEEILSDTMRLCEEAEMRYWVPQIHRVRAELARVRGDGATRERELREAHRLYTEMGAAGRAERVALELGS
jgi:ATP/maltotriose-dependent transcriptional regulator MalT